MQENEGKNFGSWAERCIKEWHENGKAVGPLIKELTQYKAKWIIVLYKKPMISFERSLNDNFSIKI